MQIANARVFCPIAIPLLICTAGCPSIFNLAFIALAPLDSPLPDCSVAETFMEAGFATIRIVCETEHDAETFNELKPIALSEQGAVLLQDFFGENDRGIDRALLLEDGVFRILGEGFPATMNREGSVVGRRSVFQTFFSTFDAVLWKAGETIDLPPLVAGGWSEAVSLSELGIVVGWATEWPALIGLPAEPRDSEPVLWRQTASGWTVTTLSGFPETHGNERLRINSAEQIMVNGSDEDFAPKSAFVWESGELTDLGSLGGELTEAADMNDAGQIVGWSETGELGEFPADPASSSSTRIRRAYLWENGVMTDLGTLGGESSEAVAINNRGDVIGWAATGEIDVVDDEDGTGFRFEITSPFLYRDGTMRDLNDLAPPSFGPVILGVIDINDSGDILATAAIDEHSFNSLIVVVTPPD